MHDLGLHDEKFSSVVVAQDRVTMFAETNCRNRKLVAVDCRSLLTDCQRFNFSSDGKYIAACNKDGTRVSILELITDSK